MYASPELFTRYCALNTFCIKVIGYTCSRKAHVQRGGHLCHCLVLLLFFLAWSKAVLFHCCCLCHWCCAFWLISNFCVVFIAFYYCSSFATGIFFPINNHREILFTFSFIFNVLKLAYAALKMYLHVSHSFSLWYGKSKFFFAFLTTLSWIIALYNIGSLLPSQKNVLLRGLEFFYHKSN
jgi:hypothetical protein